jgi:hypothetical protein
MKILFVHGIGHQSVRQGWQDSWKHTVERGLQSWDTNANVVPHFVNLDTIFGQDEYEPTWSSTTTALWRLANSCWFGVRGSSPLARGESVRDVNRWTAGMVVQWVENDQLRRETREYLRSEVARFQPDCIMAHSLGSLVAYDAFTHPGSPLRLPNGTFVSFGSQIASCYVIRNFAQGRLTSIPARRWFHLFNKHDQVFTARIDVRDDSSFRQVETTFDAPDWLNHDAAPSDDNPEPSLTYLGHRSTSDVVYRELAASAHERSILAPKWVPAAIQQRSDNNPVVTRANAAN